MPGSDMCPDGAHDLIGSRTGRGMRRCVVCGIDGQTLFDHPRGAQAGDFRVVCRTDGCGYGERTDRNGHGYTNHASPHLAQASLRAHQESTNTRHDMRIQEHPCPEITGRDDE